jgi:hypothetical protein
MYLLYLDNIKHTNIVLVKFNNNNNINNEINNWQKETR